MTTASEEGSTDPAPKDAPCTHCDGTGRITAKAAAANRAEDPWTLASTMVAIAVAFSVYEYLVVALRFDADWHPFALAGITGLAAGIVWRSAFKLAIGGAAAVAVHQTLLERAPELGFWPTLAMAAAFGVITLSIWRIVAVAASVTLILVSFKLLQDGIALEQIVDAMREKLPWIEPL